MRNVSSLRNDLEKYVNERQWEQVKPVNEHLTPYSTVGNALALCGSLGYRLVEVVETISEKTGANQTLVMASLVIGFFVILYGSIFYYLSSQDDSSSSKKKPAQTRRKKTE